MGFVAADKRFYFLPEGGPAGELRLLRNLEGGFREDRLDVGGRGFIKAVAGDITHGDAGDCVGAHGKRGCVEHDVGCAAPTGIREVTLREISCSSAVRDAEGGEANP